MAHFLTHTKQIFMQIVSVLMDSWFLRHPILGKDLLELQIINMSVVVLLDA